MVVRDHVKKSACSRPFAASNAPSPRAVWRLSLCVEPADAIVFFWRVIFKCHVLGFRIDKRDRGVAAAAVRTHRQ